MPKRRLLTRAMRPRAPWRGNRSAIPSHGSLALLAPLILLILASCGAPGAPAELIAPSPVSTRAATPAPHPVATPVPGIGPIQWTSATDPETSAPVDTVTHYVTDAPRIIAASEAIALRAGSVVEARWEYNNTSLDSLTTRLQITADVHQQWLAFTLRRDPDVLWPAGTYRITISLDGVQVQQAAVDVVDAE